MYKKRLQVVQKLKIKNGFIGGKVSKNLQHKLDEWAIFYKIAKTDVIEFCVERFLNDESIQKELISKIHNK